MKDTADVKQVRAVIECLAERLRELNELGEVKLLTGRAVDRTAVPGCTSYTTYTCPCYCSTHGTIDD